MVKYLDHHHGNIITITMVTYLDLPAEAVPGCVIAGVNIADKMVDCVWHCILALQVHPSWEMHDFVLSVHAWYTYDVVLACVVHVCT